MKSLQLIKDLFEHTYWADAQVWSVIKDNSIKTENEEKIKELIFHIHMVQYAFLKVWKCEKVDYPKVEDFKSLNEISDWGLDIHNLIKKYFENFNENDFDKIAEIPWSQFIEKQFGKKPENVTYFDTMLQVNMHSTYHRGQINTRLRELDCAPPSVDYILWLWLGRPNSKWPK